MKNLQKRQLQFGEINISEINIDSKSRDDIPKLLKGLQHLYVTPKIRGEIFQLIENMIPEKVDRGNGRPGMDLWKIFVLGVLRLGLNCDYD